MSKYRVCVSVLLIGLGLLFTLSVTAAPQGGPVVIGDGTAASCQMEDAANAFSAAVAVGGLIEFHCGPDPVTIVVNTNLTDQTVIVDGGGLITLSGEDLRQLFYVQNGGDLTLNDIALYDGNAAQGGAIYIEPQATVTLNRSFVTSSGASGDGGGIYNRGTLLLQDSTVGSNIAGANGGGIYNDGDEARILSSYLISNQAQNGGAAYTAGGQLILEQSAVRSSFTGNQGGGIYAADATLIVNSTFSNNRALQGGALFLVGDAQIMNATLYENRADIAGAIWHDLASNSSIWNTIVAGSLDSSGSAPSLNCDGPPLTSTGHNIIGDNTCVPNPSTTDDLLSTDPQLGPWQASPLRAYIPAPTSPAVDYAAICPSFDQRGYPRPIGGGCDVGSIERGDVVYLPVFVR